MTFLMYLVDHPPWIANLQMSEFVNGPTVTTAVNEQPPQAAVTEMKYKKALKRLARLEKVKSKEIIR